MIDTLRKSDVRGTALWFPLFRDTTHIKMWDDDNSGVMYDATSGDTHLIEPLGMELLRLLSQSPRSTNELVAELADVLPDDHEESTLPVIEDSLARLQDLGLVACRPN